MQQQQTSFARIALTPLIVVVAGYLIAGLTGLLVGALVGIAYVIWASRRTTGKRGRDPDALAHLDNLVQLRDKGAISDEEYQRKKMDLLERL